MPFVAHIPSLTDTGPGSLSPGLICTVLVPLSVSSLGLAGKAVPKFEIAPAVAQRGALLSRVFEAFSLACKSRVASPALCYFSTYLVYAVPVKVYIPQLAQIVYGAYSAARIKPLLFLKQSAAAGAVLEIS